MKRIEAKRGAGPSIPSPKLDVRDLRVILALASCRTTASAATTLHLTQSAVSRALTQAEAHADAALFERTPRGLVPTPACETVLGVAPRLLDELVALERCLREPRHEPRRLRLVSQCYTAYPWLPAVLDHLRRTAPDMRLELAIEHTHDPCEALLASKIDVALLTSPPPEGLASRALFSDEIVFVVGLSHPLARAAKIERADLVKHTLLIANPPTEDAWFLRKVFGAQPPRLRAQRLPVTEALLELARAGSGIGVMSEWIVAPHLRDRSGGLVQKRLAGGPLLRPWRLAYHRALAKQIVPLYEALEALAPRSEARARTA
jgi:LysR family transcriptional regulator for metE and metH